MISGQILWIKLSLDLLFTSDNLPCFLNDHQSLVKMEYYIKRCLKTPTSSLNNFPWVGSFTGLPFFPPPPAWCLSPLRFLRLNVLEKHLRCYIIFFHPKNYSKSHLFYIEKQFLKDCLVCAQTLNVTPRNVTLQLKAIHFLLLLDVLSLLSVTAVGSVGWLEGIGGIEYERSSLNKVKLTVIAWEVFILTCNICIASPSLNKSPYIPARLI